MAAKLAQVGFTDDEEEDEELLLLLEVEGVLLLAALLGVAGAAEDEDCCCDAVLDDCWEPPLARCWGFLFSVASEALGFETAPQAVAGAAVVVAGVEEDPVVAEAGLDEEEEDF